MRKLNVKNVQAFLPRKYRIPIASLAVVAFTGVAGAFAFQGDDKNRAIQYECSKGDRTATYSLDDQGVSMEFRQVGQATIPFNTRREEIVPESGIKLTNLWCGGMDVPKYMEIRTPEEKRALEAKIDHIRNSYTPSTRDSGLSIWGRYPQ